MSERESADPAECNPATARCTTPRMSSHGRVRTYRYLTITVREAVELAATGEWELPDFQREFVWKPSQVCELADSLWRGYPIGTLLLWLHHEGHADAKRVDRGLIADGLHRLTSLCLLFGREPVWFESKPAEFRRRMRQRCAVCFDVGARNDPRFVSADSRDAGRPGLIPLNSLFDFSPEVDSYDDLLLRRAQELRKQGFCADLGLDAIVNRLRRVLAIGDRELLVTALYYDRNEVIDIFQRLNSRGMKFRRVILKFAMQGLSDSLLGLRARRRDRRRAMISW